MCVYVCVRERERERQTDRQTDRQTHTQTHTQTDRHTESMLQGEKYYFVLTKSLTEQGQWTMIDHTA